MNNFDHVFQQKQETTGLVSLLVALMIKKCDTLVCSRLIEMRAISKFTYAMVVSFSPLDNNIIVISMLWELLLGML